MSDQGDPRNANTAPDALSDIDSLLDEDSEMYDDVDGDTDSVDDSDSGAADATAVSGADASEPSLPMSMPEARAPQAPTYDPDNPKGFARVGSLFADGEGNIVSRDGRIMAAKGEPARHWSNMSRQAAQGEQFKRQNDALTKQIAGNQQLIESAKALNDLPQKLGLTRDEYNAGVTILSTWKQDPLKVARDIVQKTLARGFNASDILGKTAGDAIEMGAIRQLIDEATKTQRDRESQEQISTQQRQAGEQAYNSFMARYPDAGPHTDAIAALMQQQKLDATEAYHELRYFAQQHGFDFTQPLGPQVAAAQQRQARPAPVAPQGQTYRAPMVAGNGSGNRGSLTNDTQYASADSSWGDILNSVMRQS